MEITDQIAKLTEQYANAHKLAMERITDPEQRKKAQEIFKKAEAAMLNPEKVDVSKMMETLTKDAFNL